MFELLAKTTAKVLLAILQRIVYLLDKYVHDGVERPPNPWRTCPVCVDAWCVLTDTCAPPGEEVVQPWIIHTACKPNHFPTMMARMCGPIKVQERLRLKKVINY